MLGRCAGDVERGKTMVTLGRLERVDLRGIWQSESAHFTPWLASSDNLATLSEAIGIDLELEAQEQNVGPFRADILCKDAALDRWVLIENQLEKTDHTHLGQLLNYASGLQAVTIVWIAAVFTEEHRATLDWLNEITDERFQFFGLEVELWKIADSPAAPKFNIVSKPNDWSRNVGRAARRIEGEALSALRQRQLDFWEFFRDRLIRSESNVRPQKASPQHWMYFSVGRSGFTLSATISFKGRWVEASLYIGTESAKLDFEELAKQQNEIDMEFGEALNWDLLPNRKGCSISVRRHDSNLDEETSWPALADWLQQRLERLKTVFGTRIRTLSTS